MKKYLVDFGTGAGNKEFDTIEEAKKYAEENISYTEKSIGIWAVDGEEYTPLLTSAWVERGTGQGIKKLAKIGTKGYYKDWEPFF
jgi:viroplasmin and RNaseH domain-containing protein